MFKSTAYRYENENAILTITLILVAFVLAISAVMTFAISAVLFVFMLLMALASNRSHHRLLMQKAFRVQPDNAPNLHNIASICQRRLQPGPVDIFLLRSQALNAYTFGLGNPKVIVVYEPMLRVMDGQELAFVIGHEMGHVALGHTWLNTVLGGMAGIPTPFGAAVILNAAFRWWNRACEYSSDRAGLLACGSLNRSITALVRLAAPNVQTRAEFERAFAAIDAQDDSFANQALELFQSHPMIIRRINQLKNYANTAEYHRLQAAMNENLKG